MLNGYLRQRGASLVELMITLAVSLFILAGMLTVAVNAMQSNRENLQIVRLDQELRTVMEIMGNQIQRAGYWANASNDLFNNTNTNPFMAAGNDLTIPSASCILFTYDRNNDGALPALNSGTDDERYGFRLNGGAVQSRIVGAAFDCAAAASAWENLTDTNAVTISNLQFTTIPSTGYQAVNVGGTSTVTVRAVRISITGNLAGNTSVSRTLTTDVRVFNDKFTP